MNFLRVGVWSEEPEVCSGPHGNDHMRDTGVIKQMLLDRHTALFLVKFRARFATTEPHIQVAYPLVEDIAVKCRLYFTVPHVERVEMKIVAKTTGQHDAARKFASKLCRYRQPALVIKLAFEVIHEMCLVSNEQGSFLVG